MSIAEQALFLLDIPPSISKRKNLENFTDLGALILSSLTGEEMPAKETEKTAENLYTVASRMGRSNYEEQAKAEALFNALKQMRARTQNRSPNAGRVLRGT